jgi:hypothetical protein
MCDMLEVIIEEDFHEIYRKFKLPMQMTHAY